ncbi:MAG: VOC family protein [Alphaproteobacteria bacterium]|nr:VOC family protein [Alphaproteobacteria bacterium]
MFDHVAVSVGSCEASARFYEAALAPLGFHRYEDTGQGVGFGDGEIDFWIAEGAPLTGRFHVAFRAPDRAAVDAFHAAAVAAGGRDNGAPGLRPYHPHYYAAYVLDPDGHNVEAVCHTPPSDGER